MQARCACAIPSQTKPSLSNGPISEHASSQNHLARAAAQHLSEWIPHIPVQCVSQYLALPISAPETKITERETHTVCGFSGNVFQIPSTNTLRLKAGFIGDGRTGARATPHYYNIRVSID